MSEEGMHEVRYRLLVVDDEESIRVSLQEALSDARTTVLTAASGEEAFEILASEVIDLVLLDQKLKESGEDGIDVLREIRRLHPGVVTIMMTAYGRIESAVEAIKLGCFQYITKPLDVHQLKLLIKSGLSTSRLQREVELLRLQQQRVFRSKEPFGPSPKTQELLDHVHRAAASPTSTVLIRGETGVGKELIARAIHQKSLRSGKPFIKVNCAAMPSQLIESEVFGHEPGAFTGANRLRRGRFELSEGGTIFLDEISEIPLELQAKLLGVIQEKKFERVGGSKTLSVDVRIIVATNRHLTDEITAGRFRTDLFYRLNVFPITVPPLRDRRDDIPLLVEHFVPIFAERIGKTIDQIPQPVMERLVAYDWPGNVRELRNVIERASITCPGPMLRLPKNISADLPEPHQAAKSSDDLVTLEEVERHHILKALETTGWRISGSKGAARILDINPSTLRSRMKKLRLNKT